MTAQHKFYGWRLVAVFWVVYLFNIGFVFYGSNVINTSMMLALGMSRKTLGAGFSLFHLIKDGLSVPLAAMMINRRGVRFTLVFGSVLAVLGAVVMATTVDSPVLFFLVFSVLIGVGVGFGGLVTIQTGVTYWFERKRALAMSITLTAAGIGGFIAAPILSSLIVATGNNWRSGWILIAVLCAVALCLGALFVRNKPSDLGQIPDGVVHQQGSDNPQPEGTAAVYRASRRWTAFEAMRTRNLWLIFLAIVGYQIPYLFCITHGIAHLIDRGYPPTTAAVSLGLIMLFSIIGRLMGGILGDKIEPRYIWCVSIGIMFVGILSCFLAERFFAVFLYTFCVGVGFGASFVLMPTMIGNYFGVQAFASIMGALSPLFTTFSALSPFVAGVVYDATGSYTLVFTGALIICALGVLALLAVKPDRTSWTEGFMEGKTAESGGE